MPWSGAQLPGYILFLQFSFFSPEVFIEIVGYTEQKLENQFFTFFERIKIESVFSNKLLWVCGHMYRFPSRHRYKETNTGDIGNADLISGSGRSPGVGSGNRLQYSSLENSMDPWTKELGGLQSTGSQRIRHDWADTCTYLLHKCIYIYICMYVHMFTRT